MPFVLVVALIAAAFVLAASPATAQVVTIDIEGTVTQIDDPSLIVAGSIPVGAPMTGRYQYDLSTPDTAPAIAVGQYPHDTPPYGISLSFGAVDFFSDPAQVAFDVSIQNNIGAPAVDRYVLNSSNNKSFFLGVPVDHISWDLVDPTATALNSAALPTGAPVLGDWSAPNILQITGEIGGSFYFIRVNVTSTTLVSGPPAPTLQSSQRHAGSAGFFPVHRSGSGASIGGSGGHGAAAFFTIVSLTNTDTQPQSPGSFGGSTNVHYEYVNVAPFSSAFFPTCTIFDRVEFFTPADTLSVLTNCHNAVAPGGQAGYLVVSAQDPSQFAVDWSHNDLMGSELVINSSGGMYEVAMVSFPSPVDDGEPTEQPEPGSSKGNGQLDFNGIEYAALPDQVYIDSFIAFAGSQLTLANFTGGLNARNTLAISAWNDNEFPLSATRTFACWFDQPLQVVSPLFTQAFLSQNTPDDPEEVDVDCNGTGDLETAWARIDSIDVSYPLGGQIATDGAVLGAVTAGPGSMIDGGTLLWESKATQDNGEFGLP